MTKPTSVCAARSCKHTFSQHLNGLTGSTACQEPGCGCGWFDLDDRPNCEVPGCNKKAIKEFERFWNSRQIRRDGSGGYYHRVVWVWKEQKETPTTHKLCGTHAVEFELRTAYKEEKLPGQYPYIWGKKTKKVYFKETDKDDHLWRCTSCGQETITATLDRPRFGWTDGHECSFEIVRIGSEVKK